MMTRLLNFHRVFKGWFFLAVLAIQPANAAESAYPLEVGFSQVDITPPVGTVMTGPRLPVSVGMEDPLLAKALVIASGGKTMAIVGLDLVKIRYDLAEAAIAEACERTGLAPDAVLICPSHNHSSPWIPRGGPNNAKYLAGL